MTEKEHNNKAEEKKKKRGFFFYLERILRITLRVVLGTIAVIILLIGLLIFLYQTKGFRTWITGIGLGIVNKSLIGKVEIGDLKINPFKGIDAIDVRILAAGDTVAYIPNAHINVLVPSILTGTIVINDIYINSPRIKVLRGFNDSAWNVSRISKPSEDTTPSNSTLALRIKNLNIANATIFVIDSTQPKMNDGRINFMDMYLSSFNLQLSALLKLGAKSYETYIKNLSFYEMNSRLNLSKFTLKAMVDTTHADIPWLEFHTPQSNFGMIVKADNINLMGKLSNRELENAKLKLLLKTGPANTDDILKFVKMEVPRSEPVNLNIDASGTLKKLSLGNFTFETRKTHLGLNGEAYNLLESNKLSYKAHMYNTNIEYNDLIANLPNKTGKSIPLFGSLRVKRIEIMGKPDTISTAVDFESGVGDLSGTAGIGFRKELTYRADLKTKNIDLANILRNKSMASSITGDISVHGSGTSLKALKAEVMLALYDSKFQTYNINRLDLHALAGDKGVFNIDSLLVIMPKNPNYKDIQGDEKLSLKGVLNIQDMNKPSYTFKTNFKNIDIATLSNNTSTPRQLSGTVAFQGEGFNPDSISAMLNAEIIETMFGDRNLMPFDLKAVIARTNNDTRMLSLTSNFVNVNLEGKYSFNNLISVLKTQSSYLSGFFKEKIDAISGKVTEESIAYKNEVIERFEPVSFNLKINVFDISNFASFINAKSLSCKAFIDAKLNVDSTKSIFRIDTFHIDEFKYIKDSMTLIVNPTNIFSRVQMMIEDSHPNLTEMFLRINSANNLVFDSMLIGKPYMRLIYRNDTTSIAISSSLNNMLNFAAQGNMHIGKDNLDLSMRTLDFGYRPASAVWRAVKPINISMESGNIDIKQFLMKREKGESISLAGRINSERADSIRLSITSMPLSEVQSFLPPQNTQYIESITGAVDSLNVSMDGPLANPDIDIRLITSNIVMNDLPAGSIFSHLHHKDAIVKGELDIFAPKTKTPQKMLFVDIKQLPLDLGLTGVKERLHNRAPMDITVNGREIPVVLASPFVTVVGDLKGYIDAQVNVAGNYPNSLDYNGYIKMKGVSFLLDPNNMYYTTTGEIDFVKDHINIKGITLRNVPDDLPGGRVDISGQVALNNFKLDNYNVTINSKGFMILSPASARSLPTISGDFVISTGPEPININGSTNTLTVNGNINVVNANLTVSQSSSVGTEEVNSFAKYEYYDSSIPSKIPQDSLPSNQNNVSTNTDTASTTPSEEKGPALEKNFDLYVDILDRMDVKIDLGILGSLTAKIGLPDPSQRIHYVVERNTGRLNAALAVKEGSSLSFLLKEFKTTGEISFPTGVMDNPQLNLKAQYDGQTQEGNTPKNYSVFIYITGTKDKPTVKFDYTINDQKAIGDTAQIKQEALLLLTVGRTSITPQSSSGGGSSLISSAMLNSGKNAVMSNVASQAFMGLFRRTNGLISGADVSLGEDLSQTSIKFSGQIFGGLRWKAGGNVGELMNNQEISLDYTLSNLKWGIANSMIIQLSRSIGGNTNPTALRNQKEWELKVRVSNTW